MSNFFKLGKYVSYRTRRIYKNWSKSSLFFPANTVENESHLIHLLRDCEQKLDHMFLVGEKIQTKLLGEILEVMGVLTFQADGKSQIEYSNDDSVTSSTCHHLETQSIHGRHNETLKCIVRRIVRLTAYLSERIRSPNNKEAISILMEWICSNAPDQMASMIIESCIDVLYHLCTHPGAEQLKENLAVLTFLMVCSSRRLDKTQTISSPSAFKLHHIVDHILRTETERSIRLSISLLIDVYIQMKHSY